jgi:6-phosphogluconolactonase
MALGNGERTELHDLSGLEEQSKMKPFAFSRCALSVSITARLLAGCGEAHPPIGAPGMLPASTTYRQQSGAQSASRSGGHVHYLYATNDGSASVSAFAINASTGVLTPVKGSPFAAGPEPWGIAVDPTGKFVYATNVSDGGTFANRTNVTSSSSSGSVSGYAINPRSGALTQVQGSPFPSGGSEPWEMTVGPTGKFAYVTNFYSDNVCVYAIDPKSGALTQVQGSPFETGANPAEVTADSAGFLYVANGGGESVSAYAINQSGGLTQLQGSPFGAGSYPWGVAVYSPDKFAYVTNYDSNSVSAYAINAHSGVLTQVPGSPFAAGSGTFGIAIDPAGPFLYAVNEHSDTVSGYQINTRTGALTQVQGSPFAAGADSYGVAIDPSGKFAYVANAYWGSSYGNISAYQINAHSGALTPVQGSPFTAGGGPVQLAIR